MSATENHSHHEHSMTIKEFHKDTSWVVLGTMGLMMAVSFLSSIYQWGWISISILDYTLAVGLLIFALIHKDHLLQKLMLMGLVAGIAELPIDAFLVDTGTLVYASDEPMIWRSPVYMPIAWMLVLVQMGYLSFILLRWRGMAVAILGIFLVGASYIPLYEHLALKADWWYYQNTPMVIGAPYYIILAEGLLCMGIPPIMYLVSRSSLRLEPLLGLAEAVWMTASTWIAYQILG